MSQVAVSAWRCPVCGYVHRGPQPPDCCPVCGAPGQDFEPYAEPAAAPAAAGSRQWQCLNCNYIHDGPEPPAECPVCGAARERFAPVEPLPAAAPREGEATEVVIVGGGIAGVSAAEAVRGASPAAVITLVGEEGPLPYYRLNLTRYLAGEIAVDALPIHPREWYAERRIRVITGDPAASFSPPDRTLKLAGGDVLPFRGLILAMGSHPFIPQLPGTELDGVRTLRTVDDAEAILAAALSGAPCVCIGGGVLGLETAGALARRGAKVTLLESHGWLMPRQLNRTAGGLLKEFMTGIGVRLVENAHTAEIRGSRKVQSVVLADGAVLEAGVVVLATGVRPNTHLARRAGIEVNKGILVDNHLTTSHPGIFAAGDVAEHNGMLYGVWAASQYQGSIAGLNAAGVPTAFGGLPRSNTLKVLGLDLVSIGEFEPPDGSYQVIDQQGDGNYFHFVFHDNRLVGAILLGKTSLGTAAKRAVEQKTDCSGLLARRPSARDVREFLMR